MEYAETKGSEKNSFSVKFRIKLGKIIAKSFPLNKVRISGLRLCGFTVGEKVYIGEDLIIASMISENSCKLVIGNRVAIGPRVTLVLSSDANWSELMRFMDPVRGTITLSDDCWIGAGAIILPNITIGEKAIVGAGSVVTKDVPAFTVAAGVPARIIKRIIDGSTT